MGKRFSKMTGLKQLYPFFYFFILLATISCSSPPATEKTCKYGEPQPIFSKEIQGVLKHSFKKEGQETTEKALLKNGLIVEILQSGCSEIRQEFRFIIPGKFQDKKPRYWIDRTIRFFNYLAAMDVSLRPLSAWSRYIERNAEDMKLNQKYDLAGGFYSTISVTGQDSNVLVVILEKR